LKLGIKKVFIAAPQAAGTLFLAQKVRKIRDIFELVFNVTGCPKTSLMI
jgi:hypothetical protein